MLEAVIANDHLVLGGLLVELSRWPDTPGVMKDLVATMHHRERVHMAVVEQVLLPVLAEGDERSLVEQTVTNHELVRRHLDELARSDRFHRSDVVHQLEDDLADQFAFETGMLIPAVERTPVADPDSLGFQLSQLTAAGLSSTTFGPVTGGDHDGETLSFSPVSASMARWAADRPPWRRAWHPPGRREHHRQLWPAQLQGDLQARAAYRLESHRTHGAGRSPGSRPVDLRVVQGPCNEAVWRFDHWVGERAVWGSSCSRSSPRSCSRSC